MFSSSSSFLWSLYVCAGIGAFVVLLKLWGFLVGFYKHFLRCGYNLSKRYGNKDSNIVPWVAITGSTGSLGYCYCKEFASCGFNVLFLARNIEKAGSFQEELKKIYPNIETAFLQCDLSLLSEKNHIEDFKTRLENFVNNNNNDSSNNNNNNNNNNKRDIAAFIHCATGEVYTLRFGNEDLSKNLGIMKINMFSTVVLTQLFIPYFLERNKKRNKQRSLILYIGTAASLLGSMPIFNLYVATKQFMNSFSIAASKEYEKDGIDFIISHPAFMATKLSKLEKNCFLGIISPDEYAKSSLKHCGKERISVGYWYHALMFSILTKLPFEIKLIVAREMVRFTYETLRKETLK